MTEMKVKLTFTEPILGSCSGNKELHSEYIASKAPDAASKAEEVAALGADEVEKKEMTIFPRTEDGKPFVYDYQIKGFFKNACKALNNADGHVKLTAYKTKIDNLIFIKDRRNVYEFDGEMGNMQRPLRASTAQGERIALANSEMIPAGATVEFTIMALDKALMTNVCDWLDYGRFNGFGQWHNGGYGRFIWKEIK